MKITQKIGNTPLVELENIMRDNSLKARLLAKVEGMNPGGSVKDRAALYMIEEAEKKGILRPGATIIEPTSGNTGVGLAWIGGAKGYRVILTMPETMSEERRRMLAAYGAELVLTPGNEGMNGAIEEAHRLRDSIPGAVILGQFDNPSNPQAHYETTAPEIWRDAQGQVDMLVAGIGTGGTFSGTSRRLKEFNPDIICVAVEPEGSPVLSGGKAGKHAIQGIGAGFVPANYDHSMADRIITVTDQEAMETGRLLARNEGILAGISSGAAVAAAIKLARRDEYAGKTIVVILPDSGDRYFSTPLFD